MDKNKGVYLCGLWVQVAPRTPNPNNGSKTVLGIQGKNNKQTNILTQGKLK